MATEEWIKWMSELQQNFYGCGPTWCWRAFWVQWWSLSNVSVVDEKIHFIPPISEMSQQWGFHLTSTRFSEMSLFHTIIQPCHAGYAENEYHCQISQLRLKNASKEYLGSWRCLVYWTQWYHCCDNLVTFDNLYHYHSVLKPKWFHIYLHDNFDRLYVLE